MHKIILAFVLSILPVNGAELRLIDRRGDPDPHTKTHFNLRHFDSSQDWLKHRELLRRRVLVSAGLWPMPNREPVGVRSFGLIPRTGYTVERILVETLPGFHVGANVYRPARQGGNRPGVLVAHGHWNHGRIEHTDAYSVPALCAALAVNGYVAVAYDMVGYNDTRQIPHKFGDSEQERLWSFGPMQLQLWNSIRFLDWLAAEPDVDASRLAVTGASGGGTQTYLLAAVDERIQVSIPVDMVSARFQGDDPCEMAPGLRVGTNNVELAAAMAPRPMLLLSSSQDWTSDSMQLEFPAIREVYSLLGREENAESLQVDAEHGYNALQRQAALQFLGKHFRMPSDIRAPEEFSSPPLEFLIGPKVMGSLPYALDQDGVFRAWQRLLTERNDGLAESKKSKLLSELTGGHWPTRVLFVNTRGEGFLHRDGADDIVPARLIPGRAKSSVIAFKGAGGQESAVKEASVRGDRVLVIEPFEIRADAARGRHGDHLVFHHSEDSNRVQDILTAAAWLTGEGAQSIGVLCGQPMEEVCRLAASISPVELRLDTGSSRRRTLSIPGLLGAGYRDEPAN